MARVPYLQIMKYLAPDACSFAIYVLGIMIIISLYYLTYTNSGYFIKICTIVRSRLQRSDIMGTVSGRVSPMQYEGQCWCEISSNCCYLSCHCWFGTFLYIESVVP